MQHNYHSRARSARKFNQPRRNFRGKPASNINPSRFINHATAQEEVAEYVPMHQFNDFALCEGTKKTLEYLGFTTPSAIQDMAIPHILGGKDVIGLANTGTGKTAAFLLPIIEKLHANPKLGSILILAPTRELAQQIDSEFRRFAAGQKLYSAVCVGGANINLQIRELRRGPHVIIGTPGRLKDLLQRRVLILNNVNTFVLDEADRMLDMGFVNDIRALATLLPPERQTLCFSATMTPGIKTVVEDFMQQPETVSVVRQQTADHIDQDVVRFRDTTDKLDTLMDLLGQESFSKVIIFGETKHGVQRLADTLTKNGQSAVAIHGNKSQAQRERALRQFKANDADIMVATDVAARGLDIPDVSHVINYDIPRAYEDYIHRIGRTGRAGKSGKAITFIAHSK